jgi:hypothetical protein
VAGSGGRVQRELAAMLLVVDVGNTQTHFGTFRGEELVEHTDGDSCSRSAHLLHDRVATVLVEDHEQMVAVAERTVEVYTLFGPWSGGHLAHDERARVAVVGVGGAGAAIADVTLDHLV